MKVTNTNIIHGSGIQVREKVRLEGGSLRGKLLCLMRCVWGCWKLGLEGGVRTYVSQCHSLLSLSTSIRDSGFQFLAPQQPLQWNFWLLGKHTPRFKEQCFTALCGVCTIHTPLGTYLAGSVPFFYLGHFSSNIMLTHGFDLC